MQVVFLFSGRPGCEASLVSRSVPSPGSLHKFSEHFLKLLDSRRSGVAGCAGICRSGLAEERKILFLQLLKLGRNADIDRELAYSIDRGLAVCSLVHAGGGSQDLRHGGHHIRIYHCDIRDIVGVDADKLTLSLHVGDEACLLYHGSAYSARFRHIFFRNILHYFIPPVCPVR